MRWNLVLILNFTFVAFQFLKIPSPAVCYGENRRSGPRSCSVVSL
jgi:hypothetical protein